MENLLRNVFGGIFVTTAVAVMAILVAMLVHGFMDECLKAQDDVAEVAAIVSGVAVVVGGIIGGVLYYIA